mgnify:FL=1
MHAVPPPAGAIEPLNRRANGIYKNEGWFREGHLARPEARFVLFHGSPPEDLPNAAIAPLVNHGVHGTMVLKGKTLDQWTAPVDQFLDKVMLPRGLKRVREYGQRAPRPGG